MTRTTRFGTGIRAAARAAAVATLAVGLAAGCSSDNEQADQADEAATCVETPNGTPITASPEAAPPPGAPPTTQNLSTNPEIATGYRSDMTAVHTASFAVSTANPVSTKAACEVLAAGGTAADALITAQTVLGLVEPQSSGIGGGAFLLYYDKDAGTVDAYDGREVAPAAATENYLRWISDTDQTVPQPDARASGRSIGVPGVLRMLQMAHNDHGETTWSELFQPAISLADQGLTISPRMAGQIAESAPQLAVDDNARAYFLNPDGSPKAAGTTLTNPAMSKTLSAIATDGADAFYTGAIAANIIEAQAHHDGRAHARADDPRRPRRLRGEEAHRAVHGLPRARGLRHAEPVVGWHRGRVHARHPVELRPVHHRTDRRRPQRRQADRRGGAPDLGGRTARLRRPRQVRRRLRFRSAARQFAGHAAGSGVPEAACGADRPEPVDGHRAAGRLRSGAAEPADPGP